MEKAERVKYLFDASALYALLKRFPSNLHRLLSEIGILDLMKYEIGNALWVEARRGRVSDWLRAAEAWSVVLRRIPELSIESLVSAEELAVQLQLTFYDAAYVSVAREKNLVLVTEDEEMHAKAQHIGVQTLTVEEFVTTQQRANHPHRGKNENVLKSESPVGGG